MMVFYWFLELFTVNSVVFLLLFSFVNAQAGLYNMNFELKGWGSFVSCERRRFSQVG